MDSIQIAQVLQSCTETRTVFAGVFAANRLPRAVMRRPTVLVVNSQTDSFPGSHWSCFYLPMYETGVEYFDSLGAAPTLHYFLRFINRNGGLLRYSHKALQFPASDVCGEYCCVFALERTAGVTLRHFLAQFERRKLKNDRLVLFKFNAYFTCNTHFSRPELRTFHVQTCAPQCHVRALRCEGERARSRVPRRARRRPGGPPAPRDGARGGGSILQTSALDTYSEGRRDRSPVVA